MICMQIALKQIVNAIKTSDRLASIDSWRCWVAAADVHLSAWLIKWWRDRQRQRQGEQKKTATHTHITTKPLYLFILWKDWFDLRHLNSDKHREKIREKFVKALQKKWLKAQMTFDNLSLGH